MAILIVRSKSFTILSGVLLVFPYFLITGCVAPYPAPVVESQRNLNQTIDKAPVSKLTLFKEEIPSMGWHSDMALIIKNWRSGMGL